MIKTVLNKILEPVFPERCVVCGKNGSLLCDQCQPLFIIPETRCTKCGRPLPSAPSSYLCQSCLTEKKSFVQGICFFQYFGAVKEWIHNIKYKKNVYQIKILDLYKSKIIDALAKFECDTVVPIPITAEHAYKRGFNQSLLIAQKISQWIEKPISTALMKTHFTVSQTSLSSKERKKNVKNSFIADKKINGKNVLIIDDVFTTGSTINEAAKAIKKYSNSVYFFTMAGV